MSQAQNNITNNNISKNFKILPINLHPQQALLLMGKSNYGVICRVVTNQVQEVITLITKEDLKRVNILNVNTLLEIKYSLPPTIIVNSQPDAEIKVSFPPNIKESIDNIKGAVVVNNQTVVGIIPASEVRAYLNDLTVKGEIEVGGYVEMGDHIEVGNNLEYSPDQDNLVFPGL